MHIDQTDNLSLLSSSQDPSTLFAIQFLLGTGSYGEVWKAVRLSDNFPVAIKCVPLARNGVDRKEIGRILNEVKILRECNHPNVVSYLGCFMSKCTTTAGNSLWIVMEFCEGGSAESRLNHSMLQGSGFTEHQITLILFKALQGLAYLHSKGQMHRDLKAGNILLTDKGNVKLADFGVSTQLSQATLMRKKTVIGTPYWMAPEVILAEDDECSPYGLAADIWSIGITAIELAQGKPPLYDYPPMRALFMIPKEAPPRLQGDQWSDSLKEFIASCLKKDPNSRPSARDLLQHRLFHTLHPSDVLNFDPLSVSCSSFTKSNSNLEDSMIHSSDLSDTFLINDSPTRVIFTTAEKAHCGLHWKEKIILGCESGLWIGNEKIFSGNVLQLEMFDSSSALVLAGNLHLLDLQREKLFKISDTKGATFVHSSKEIIFLAFQKRLIIYEFVKQTFGLKKRMEYKLPEPIIMQIQSDHMENGRFLILTPSSLLRISCEKKEMENLKSTATHKKPHQFPLMRALNNSSFPCIGIHHLEADNSTSDSIISTFPDKIIRISSSNDQIPFETRSLRERLIQSKLIRQKILLLIFVSGTAIVSVQELFSLEEIQPSIPGEAYLMEPDAFINWSDEHGTSVYSIK